MPARRYKSLYKEKGHRMHREHRSKKGRKRPIPQWGKIKLYKDRYIKLKERELMEENMI